MSLLDDNYVSPKDLAAQVGGRVAVNADEVESAFRRERLQKSRHVDLVVAAELLSLGWRQVGQLDGLSWCVACGGPTVWIDATGAPRHHTCMEA